MQVTPGSMDALCSLLHTPFFHPCPTCSTGGSAQRDTTVNHFNLDSLVAGCSHCLPAHGSGQRVLQVRRSSYHDVLKVSDIARLMDTSGIQTYTINGSKVVFIKRRPQTRPTPKGTAPASARCEICARLLQDASRWCSMECKFDGVGACPASAAKFGAQQLYDASALAAANALAAGQAWGAHSGSYSPSESPPSTPLRAEQLPYASAREVGAARWPGVAHFGPCSLEAYAATATSRRKGFPHRAPFE